ncbi:ankyrin repeat-containing domain protein [Hypoxylon argillaceum]|nr:ankyrin repeat-containing domain protein [Hypoxylon argillaceum]
MPLDIGTYDMNLFQLPPEVVHLIFDRIVTSRILERVMRIRIVSRLFKTYIDYSVFRLGLLIPLINQLRPIYPGPRPRPPIYPMPHPPLSYIHSYIIYRVLWERSTTSSLSRIRRAATALCEEDGDAGNEAVLACIHSLVHLAISTYPNSLLKERRADELEKCSDEELKADIYVAAIYLNKHSYVESLIDDDGVEFCSVATRRGVHSTIFGDAFQVATMQGNLEMIKLLLSCIAEYREAGVLPQRQQHDIMESASMHGHQAAFDFALDMRPISLPKEGMSRRGNRDARALYNAIDCIPFPRSYERMAAMLGPDSRVFTQVHREGPTSWLRRSAHLGNVEMVRYFLHQGAKPDFERRGPGHSPLLRAVQSQHETIIRLLLDAGADPNRPPPPNTPLAFAVLKGNIPVVRLLLSHAANVNEGSPPPIVIAVFRENMVMFRLLREHGARLDTPETGG